MSFIGNLTTLKMGFLPFPPWIVITGMVGEKYQIDGIQFKIINTICSMYNISLEAYMGRNYEFGVVYPNGSVDGMIAQLLDKETDLILGPWVLSEIRTMPSRMSESTVFFTSNIVILASTGQSEPSSFFGFLYTFDGEIWFALIAGFISLIILSAIGDTLFEKRTSVTLNTYANHIKKTIKRYFWMYLATLFSEGSNRNPSSRLSKNMLVLWLLMILILTSGFTGQFKSILMVRSKSDIIDTIQQLAQRKEVIAYMPQETIFSEVFRFSPLEDYKKIYENSIKGEGIIHRNRFLSQNIYQIIKDGKGVAVTDTTIVKFVLSMFCRNLTNDRTMYFVKETFYPYNYVFVFRKDLPEPFLNGMNKRIQWLYEGHIINKWIEDTGRVFEKCGFQESIENNETPLGMEHLLPLFLLQGFFLLCCTIVFFFEMVSKIGTRKPQSRVN